MPPRGRPRPRSPRPCAPPDGPGGTRRSASSVGAIASSADAAEQRARLDAAAEEHDRARERRPRDPASARRRATARVLRPGHSVAHRARAASSRPSRRVSDPRGTRPRSLGAAATGNGQNGTPACAAASPRVAAVADAEDAKHDGRRSHEREHEQQGREPAADRARAQRYRVRRRRRSIAHRHRLSTSRRLSGSDGVVFPMPTCSPSQRCSRPSPCSSWPRRAARCGPRPTPAPRRATAISWRSRARCRTTSCCASGADGGPIAARSSASCPRSRTSSAPGCRTSVPGTTSRPCRCSGTAPGSCGPRARSTARSPSPASRRPPPSS